MDYDEERIDEVALALLAAFSFDGGRSWKGFDFGVLDRLHAKGMLGDPVGRAKSVWLTEQGLAQGLRAAERLFGVLLSKSD